MGARERSTMETGDGVFITIQPMLSCINQPKVLVNNRNYHAFYHYQIHVNIMARQQ